MSVRVEHADMLEAIPRLVAEGVLVDAIVCDPPYGLEFMGKEWDKLDGGLPQENVWKGRRGKGGSSIGDDDATPGSRHHVGFGSNRAGFKRCTICGKRSFSGSPCRCAAPEWVTEYPDGPPSSAIRMQRWHEQWAREAIQILKPGGYLIAFGGTRTYHRMVCGLEDAGFVIQDTIAWLYGTGFPKNRAHLKPAFEPIVLAYKPGGKRTMQVDECRITGRTEPVFGGAKGNGGIYGSSQKYLFNPSPLGRWPANVVHDGSDEVLAGFPDTQTHGHSPHARGRGGISTNGHAGQEDLAEVWHDSGSAARFFFSAKAGAQDRWGSRHPTVKPVDLIAWLVALVTPPGGTFLDPFAGSGTAGVAALKTGRSAILIEREAAYIGDIRERMAHYAGIGRHSLVSKARNAADKPLGGLFL